MAKHRHRQTTAKSRRPRLGVVLLLIVVAAAICATCSQIAGQLLSQGDARFEVATAMRRSLQFSVTEYAVLEPITSVDIRCELPGGGAILWVIEEGSSVRRGDEVLVLDSTEIDVLIAQQKFAVELARAAAITAEQVHAVARIALREYENAAFVNEDRAAQVAITLAEENLRAAKITLEHVERVAAKGYVSKSELERAALAVEQSRQTLELAKSARRVLVELTKPKMLQQLTSAADAARAVQTAERRVLAIESDRLAQYESRKDRCIYRAPCDGVVAYVDDFRNMSRFWTGSAVAEGNRVYRDQRVLKIPDLSRMRACVLVPESRINQIAPGMNALVCVGAKEFRAAVASIANLPEPASEDSSAGKMYAVDVEIASRVEGLRPRTPARVEIATGALRDILTVPVEAVSYEHQRPTCWVRGKNGFASRAVRVGRSNLDWIEVLDGLAEKDEVLANARAGLDDSHGDIDDAAPAFQGSAKRIASAARTSLVRRGDLRVTLHHPGWTNGQSSTDVTCRLKSGTINWIIDSGSLVKRGQTVVAMDSTTIESERLAQEIAVARIETTLAAAQGVYRSAAAAPDEYIRGTYQLELMARDTAVALAEHELRAAERPLELARQMLRRGYVSQLKVDSLAFAASRRRLELDAARTARDSLVEFTRPKMIKELTGARDAALAQLRAQEALLFVERAKLDSLEQDQKDCVYTAPADGLVIHAHGAGKFMEAGTTIGYRRKIIQLPDVSKMRVDMYVHQSKLGQLRAGMPAIIHIGQRRLAAHVTDPGTRPAPQSFGVDILWRDDYQVMVDIDDDPTDLRPNMVANVEFILHDLHDVLKAPIEAVVEIDGRFCCWVRAGEGFERRDVTLGPANDREVQVLEGLASGEMVVLRPRSVLPDARVERLQP